MKVLKGIRWTIESAASEFGRHPKTIATRLKQDGIEAGEDGRFSTKQIVSAIFGDIEGEKLQMAKNQNKLLEIEIKEAEKTLIPVEFVEKAWESQMTSLRQAIMFSGMSEDAKRDSLETLMQIPVDEYFSYAKEQSDESEAEVAEAS